MKAGNASMWENNLSGLITGFLMWNGCERLAYPNIVAGGSNATTLHYEKNNCEIKDGDLVLIDAGGEYNYYASDITRTWPINGKFTPEQRRIYNIVLDAQEQCINAIKPGITIGELQKLSSEIITKGLIEVCILKGTFEENMEKQSYRQFYMHGLGHWMGIDVHDCSSVDRKTTTVEAGYVFTVEPGIYISKDAELPDGFDAYCGIGIRIEDDILVTDNGSLNLTRFVPKDPYIIEKMIGTELNTVF
jgi:Xaa-Pro aminopeptidase